MRYLLLFTVTFFIGLISYAQDVYGVKGRIVSSRTNTPISEASIGIDQTNISELSDKEGYFHIESLTADVLLTVEAPGYSSKKIELYLEKAELELGTIWLDDDVTIEQSANLITLTDSELTDDNDISNPSGLLQATRDVFLQRAAFDFGQAFFRVKGYDSSNGEVSINGISMNKFYDGRPQWNNWGGLNDILRNQQFSNGMSPSDYTFGGILGNTNIDVRPTGLRKGTRLTASASNRTYTGRLMATYNSGLKDNGLAYTVSSSKRWGGEGYIDGTLYDAYSFFGGLEYHFNNHQNINFTGILASNRRGRSSAITEEIFNLMGNTYNPYWGEQNDKIRNSRERKITEPILMFNHRYESDKVSINSGIAYQFGTHRRSRLGYYNAPNPDPTYYRYLPSFYINSPLGANFKSAVMAEKGFVENPQINWSKLYTANNNGMASYMLYDDVIDDEQYTVNTIANIYLNNNLQLDFGVNAKFLQSSNYAQIDDLLGADYHSDIDTFSSTLNDVNGSIEKRENDIFNYNYQLSATEYRLFGQARYHSKKFNVFSAIAFKSLGYSREGLFQNERFNDTSLGKSEDVSFQNIETKAGFGYKINDRHWLDLNAAYILKAPTLQNTFINPRENNLVVPEIQNERLNAIDFSYHLRLPKLSGRLSAYYTRFQNTTDINFFFVDTGVGSDFVQEVLTDLDKLHKGLELGLEYQVSSYVKLSAVAAVGRFVYASNPNVRINFDTAGREEDLINLDGALDLGPAMVKDYKLAQGPQQAYSIGIEYRDPKYWWLSMTTNYLKDSYINISTITRTQSFLLDPETGQNFPDATEENVAELLRQSPLEDFYLLNLVGGKSWLQNGKYISVFASINNLFNATFRTGGYEQSRNGNFGQLRDDNLSGSPSFAPKYWYGYGRTYFVNLAFSF
ncbi:MAG: TonB-dependent receptor [Pseudozobellia sp.]|nr:TonB-dependent receptor [Pseudozobellia sp.]MBG46773.1 TonB-dependent receptor [Pseudozobellia sp.]|tara:strand:- start:1155397 stop:1158123 length:2727 start_codon:yes stop_codon:yes gene_type:complete